MHGRPIMKIPIHLISEKLFKLKHQRNIVSGEPTIEIARPVMSLLNYLTVVV